MDSSDYVTTAKRDIDRKDWSISIEPIRLVIEQRLGDRFLILQTKHIKGLKKEADLTGILQRK